MFTRRGGLRPHSGPRQARDNAALGGSRAALYDPVIAVSPKVLSKILKR